MMSSNLLCSVYDIFRALLQHFISKASILFMSVLNRHQLSQPCVAVEKCTILLLSVWSVSHYFSKDVQVASYCSVRIYMYIDSLYFSASSCDSDLEPTRYRRGSEQAITQRNYLRELFFESSWTSHLAKWIDLMTVNKCPFSFNKSNFFKMCDQCFRMHINLHVHPWCNNNCIGIDIMNRMIRLIIYIYYILLPYAN